MGRRETVFGDDIVEIMLDTFHDERRAYAFITNPFGIQSDAIWTEGNGFDFSFDTVWDSVGRLTDQGYVVRFAIPFSSLRFPRTTGAQTRLTPLADPAARTVVAPTQLPVGVITALAGGPFFLWLFARRDPAAGGWR